MLAKWANKFTPRKTSASQSRFSKHAVNTSHHQVGSTGRDNKMRSKTAGTQNSFRNVNGKKVHILRPELTGINVVATCILLSTDLLPSIWLTVN